MIDFVFLSEKGKRENNEDAHGHVGDELFFVADGLGGRPAGEVASKIAVETAIPIYKTSKKEEPEEVFNKIFVKANREVLQKSREKKEYSGMGTTLTCALIRSNEVNFANVGDCRAYIFSEGALRLKTVDDRDNRGTLLAALGIDEKVEPHISKDKLGKGDIVLLCSDGLSDFVKEKPIEKILGSDASLKDKAEGLIDAALQFGSTDNITIALISKKK